MNLRYRDPHPLLDLCVQAQEYYKRRSLPTKVKACSNANLDELLQLAGVDALTLVPDDMKALKAIYRDTKELNDMSLFKADRRNQDTTQNVSYINDELKYRADFSRVQDGRAQAKLAEVCYYSDISSLLANYLFRPLTYFVIFKQRQRLSSGMPDRKIPKRSAR